MKNTVKDNERMLPSIFPPEWEYQLSSIYVEAETPKVNIQLAILCLGYLQVHSVPNSLIYLTIFYAQGRYGTRSTSVISVKTSGEVRFFESHLESNLWKEQTVTYQVETMK